jgi:hypothetical protein
MLMRSCPVCVHIFIRGSLNFLKCNFYTNNAITFSSYLARNALRLHYKGQLVDICTGIITVECANSKIIQNYCESNTQIFYNVTHVGINNRAIWWFQDVVLSQTT